MNLTAMVKIDGHDRNGQQWSDFVMVHTFHPIEKAAAKIRVISARKATRAETKRYHKISREKLMKKEYDFSKGVRGKFYHPGIELYLPIYLERETLQILKKLSKKKGGRDVGNCQRMDQEGYIHSRNYNGKIIPTSGSTPTRASPVGQPH